MANKTKTLTDKQLHMYKVWYCTVTCNLCILFSFSQEMFNLLSQDKTVFGHHRWLLNYKNYTQIITTDSAKQSSDI